MLVKIIGSLLIIGASTVIGLAWSREYAKRPGQLRELQGQLQVLQNELNFLSSPLPDAFRKVAAAGSPTSVFFRVAAGYLSGRKGVTAARAWEMAVRENLRNTSLNREDEEIVIAFGNMLGGSDLDGQLRNIRLTLSQLELQEKKAEESRKKNEPMYRNLGLLGGLALVIFLF